MTMNPTRRDYAQLFARARAALESRVALGAAERDALIEDLAIAGDHVAGTVLPWPIDVHVATIEHREGVNHYVASTRAALMAEVAEFCREWWPEIRDNRDPASLDDETVSNTYFLCHETEALTTDRVQLAPAPAGGNVLNASEE